MNLSQIIENAGILGCGGAGFPTHIKLNKSYEYFIVNGAECEPLLRNDRYLMRTKPDEIVSTVARIKQELGIGTAVICLKAHYEREAAALKESAARLGADVVIQELESFYPAGDEQALVYEVTGRVVPPAGLPGDVGAVVDNVATVYAIYEALSGIPYTHRYLTVTGYVNDPVIIYAPVGASFKQCIEMAGGPSISDYVIVSGGPMMGKLVPDLDNAFVTKTTSGILVLPADGIHASSAKLDVRHMLTRAKSACIQCESCTSLCPRHMLGHPIKPHKIMRKMAAGGDVRELLDDTDIKQALICCECGICETYACPMGLNPRKINQLIKAEYAKAGIRYSRTESSWEPNPEREVRKAPTDRVAGKLGLYRMNKGEIDTCLALETDEVCIQLKMGAGPAPLPCVKEGDFVQAGMLIASPAAGALGARVHSPISGYVTLVTGNSVVISAR